MGRSEGGFVAAGCSRFSNPAGAGVDGGSWLRADFSRPPRSGNFTVPFLLVLLVIVVFIYFGVRLIIRVFYAPRDIGRWHGRRNALLARQATLDGYARLIEGDWEAAEKILTRRLSYSATPLLDCLGAAYAAQRTAIQKQGMIT